MKKLLFFLPLAWLIGACSNQPLKSADSTDMLTFDEIAAEISVEVEDLESPAPVASTTNN